MFGGDFLSVRVKSRALLVSLVCGVMLLSGCDVEGEIRRVKELSFSDVLKGLFEVRAGGLSDDKDLDEHVYSTYDQEKSLLQTVETEERFVHKTRGYVGVVNKFWVKEGFYKHGGMLSDKERLIDFYLFMEYHKDVQKRNLQFPEYLQKDLLLMEAMFAKKAIDHVDTLDIHNKEMSVLRDDMVTLYRNMYREELINVLYEGHQQVDVVTRIPNIMDRYTHEFDNRGLRERVRAVLGIPDSVISRGIGLDMVTLYGNGTSVDDGDASKLAVLLAMEMRLSGINMRLERFFHVTNSLDGLGTDLVELEKDVRVVRPQPELLWVQERMLRSIDYLDSVYLYYRGDRKLNSASQIFMDLETREDFYALGMLSKNIKEVMDREDYWDEAEEIKQQMDDTRRKRDLEAIKNK